jgi:hypothetical protein
MKIFALIPFLFLLNVTVHYGQQKQAIKGQVLVFQAENALPGANVYWENSTINGTVTDLNGNFSLDKINLPAKLIISYLGFSTIQRIITDKDLDKPLKFYLTPEDFALQEVMVRDLRSNENVVSMDLGKTYLPVATIKNIPALFGEIDVLRTLQLLPGVQNAGEGTTGLFVRGGAADQNLIQLDGAPVYNPSHFFGFFSAFNPDALKGVDFFKGNIPANHGGRISSLIDVSLKEGNMQTFAGEGGIGTISSRLTLEGPIQKDKSSFIISGRRTYADMFLKLSSDPTINNNRLYFYDLSGKFSFQLSAKDKLSFTSFHGSDYLGLDRQFGIGWFNLVNSLVWKRNIRDNFYFDLNVYRSQFEYSVTFDDPERGFVWKNRLSESGVKGEWLLLSNLKHQFKWGFHSQYYHFAPVNFDPTEGGNFSAVATNSRNAIQNNLFFTFQKEFSTKFSTEIGIRYGLYEQIGRGTQYLYEGGTPEPNRPVLDTLTFDPFRRMKFYSGLEPRFSARYAFKDDLSTKFSYNRNFQYIQIVSNSSAGLPFDRWLPAGPYMQPLRGDQFSLGIYKNLKEDTYELSVEGYYRSFHQIVDLRQGANVIVNDNVETEILSGKGKAYGVEFLLKKNVGQTTGWIAYTYSRTWRKIEGISQGEWYNPRFDRPNDFTVVFNHEFSERWSAGLTYVYTTGLAVTFPLGAYTMDNQRVPLYSERRNEDRFPDYHRMDASVTYKNASLGKKWKGSWNFSIYNLYGRKNPFSYQFTEIINDNIRFDASSGDEVVSRRPGVVMTYLFTFLPAITYNFKF